MKIHLLFITRSFTTANIDMTKNIYNQEISKKLYKKKLMFHIYFNDKIKKYSIVVTETESD